MNIRILYFYILLNFVLSVNSRFFGKILFSRYFNNLLKKKPANNKNTLFNNTIYNDVKNSIKPINSINPNITEIDIIIENTDRDIYIIFEHIFYTVL